MNNEKETVLELKQICKSFRQGSQKLDVLTGVDLEIKSGEIVALIGPSGSGKSTLLQIAGLLETPSSAKFISTGRTVPSSATDCAPCSAAIFSVLFTSITTCCRTSAPKKT